jgi:hypothetical protein
LNNNTVRQSVIDAAEKLTGGNSRASSGIETVFDALVTVQKKGKRIRNKLFNQARATDASLDYAALRSSVDKIEADLIQQGFNLADGTPAAKHIASLRALDTTIPGVPGKEATRPGQGGMILGPDGKPLTSPAPTNIPLNDIDLIQRKIGEDIRAAVDKPKDVALIKLRAGVQKHIDDAFVNDMIVGDKTAKDKWRAAYGAAATLRKNFNTKKVVGKLAQEERTPMDTARLILGASENKYKPQAHAIVKQLGEVLGKDSPEFQSIRTAVMADLFDPLFQEKPNFAAVEKRIRLRRKNDMALLNELGIDNKQLEIMRRASIAAKAAFVPDDVDRLGLVTGMVTRYVAGHDIAQAAVRVRVANMLADKLLGVGQKTPRPAT